MIGSSRQSGDTLVTCHFPSWQISVQTLCSSVKRPSRLCAAGLTRAVSLPERNSLSTEQAFKCELRPFSSSYSSLTEERPEEDGSDSSGRYEPSSSPEDSAQIRSKASVRSHNSFLPCSEMDEDEEDDDSDGDNLHRYCEDSSFVLHGNTNWPVSNSVRDLIRDNSWANEGTMFGCEFDQDWTSDQPNQMDNLQDRCQCFHMSDASVALLANVAETESSDRSCCVHSLRKVSPELLSNTDSSCNSSDGVLVNFCTIYNRSNSPATPLDLSSPTLEPAQGSVFLNLQPVAPQHAPAEARAESRAETRAKARPEARDEARAEAGLSPHVVDSNCNLYCVEPLPAGLSSLEASDLNACLQNRAALPVGTNQKYYKLVSCDLSSQSPSPAWCSSAAQSQNSSPSADDQQSEHRKAREDQQVERCLSESTKLLLSSASPSSGSGSSKCQGTSTEPTHPSVLWDRDHSVDPASDRGQTSAQTLTDRFTKAQRPTSLPIRPFVLVSAEKPAPPQSELLGGLLEQYIHQQKNASSQPSFTFKGKRSQRFTNMQLSPMGSQCPIFLEAPSTSDSCSTCSPSPDCFRHIWSRSGISPSMLQPKSKLAYDRTSPFSDKNGKITYDRTSPFSDKDVLFAPSKTSLVKIPTYRNLIHLTPEQQDNQRNTSKFDTDAPDQVPVSPPSPAPDQNKLPQYRAAPVCGFMRAVSSAGPLSSLLSSWTSYGSSPQIQDCSEAEESDAQPGERPPVELCLSPETSYESMSISHLQRRGLLRAVSRAVDLIMAHFGSSRDPEEKLRLGDSSRSPTIAGLVLEHLCPSIQNILEDGLKDHKLDPIIGQRPSDSWRVVEVSTRIGPSTKVLNCLVSKIKQYPQLTDHCMRLRAFIMGLLNLRSLEFWLSHLNNQKDVVASHYHSWSFMSMSLWRCQTLFQELLLMLQPLSVLPFDLNLLLEPRLLCHRGSDQTAPSSGLLATSWPLLQADSRAHSHSDAQTNTSHPRPRPPPQPTSRSLFCAAPAEAEDQDQDQTDQDQDQADHWSQVSMESRSEEQRKSPVLNQSQCEGGLRWAKLFGAAGLSTSSVAASQSHSGLRRRLTKRPSQWLNLDRSQLGLLAQSLMSMKL